MRNLSKVTLLVSAMLIVGLPYYGPSVCDAISEYSERGCLFANIKQPIYCKAKISLYMKWLPADVGYTDIKEVNLDSIEFILMKNKLSEAVIKHNHEVHGNKGYAIDLGNYGVQYVAFIDESGNKQVWMHGFDIAEYSRTQKYSGAKQEIDFYSQTVDGIGGGNSYFSTIISLTKEEPAKVFINGPF